MRVTLDHKKTSEELRNYLADYRWSEAGFKKRLPMNFYPRMETEEGRRFLAQYLVTISDYKMVETFIQRGMNLNAVDEEGYGLLHYVADGLPHTSQALRILLKNATHLDLNVTTSSGKKPIDLMYNVHPSYGQYIYAFIQAELQHMDSMGKTEAECKEHLMARFRKFLTSLPDDAILDIVPEKISYDDRFQNGSAVFELALHGRLTALEALLDRPDFRVPDYKEKVVQQVAKKASSPASLLKKLRAHGYTFSHDVLEAVLEKNGYDALGYVLNQMKADGETYDAAYRRTVFNWLLVNKSVTMIRDAMLSPHFSRVADLDAPVFKGNTTLLMKSVTDNNHDKVKALLEMGASVLCKNAAGETVMDLMLKVRDNKQTRELLQAKWESLNRQGDYDRLDNSQIAWKRGVLTYVFDFSAGQVLVRDHETKALAMQSMADFGKSGLDAIENAAEALEALGGDAKGFGAAGARIGKSAPRL